MNKFSDAFGIFRFFELPTSEFPLAYTEDEVLEKYAEKKEN